MASLLPLVGQSLSLTQQCSIGGNLQMSRIAQLSSAMAVLLSSSSTSPVSGMISNISVAPSSTWYFSLTPFESILLGMIVLKLMLLRYLTILPININNIANSDFFDFGKRKKRELEDPKAKEKERLAETMFTVVRRLDMQDCLLRTLCELQVHSTHGYKLPRETKLTLSALSKSGWQRKLNEKPELNPDVIQERPILSVFEEAVQIGWEAKSHNGTECQERYFICPLSTKDILAHFETAKVINVL